MVRNICHHKKINLTTTLAITNNSPIPTDLIIKSAEPVSGNDAGVGDNINVGLAVATMVGVRVSVGVKVGVEDGVGLNAPEVKDGAGDEEGALLGPGVDVGASAPPIVIVASLSFAQSMTSVGLPPFLTLIFESVVLPGWHKKERIFLLFIFALNVTTAIVPFPDFGSSDGRMAPPTLILLLVIFFRKTG